MCNWLIKKLIHWVIGCLVFFWCFTGCAPHDYKAEADEQVYKIIDRKWQESFGPRANYHISDAIPSPNDIQIENYQYHPAIKAPVAV